MKKTLAAAILAVSAWGCTPGEAEATRGEDGRRGTEDTGAAEWVSTAPGGTEVTMRPDRYPVEVGSTEFHITLDRPVPQGTTVSIDIVSPEMPAMGILRYHAEAMGPLDYTARAEIAMDGAWEVYVNLGDGTDAASFAFDVEPGSTGGHQHGGTMSGAEEDHEPAVGERDAHAHGDGR